MVRRSTEQFHQSLLMLNIYVLIALLRTITIIPSNVSACVFTVQDAGKQSDERQTIWLLCKLCCVNEIYDAHTFHSSAETNKQEQCILITTCRRIKLYLLCRFCDTSHLVFAVQ